MSTIAYLLGHFPTLSETFVGAEMRALQALGHRIVPIALHDPRTDFQPDDHALAAATRYFAPIDPERSRALVARYRFRYWRANRFIRSQTTEPDFALRVHGADLADYIRAQQCTHVHAHFAWGAATYAIVAARLARLPVTFTCHGSDVYARTQDLVLKCRSADAVVAVSPALASAVQQQAPRAHVRFIPCGVDPEQFRPLADATARHRRWLYVGRLIACKGLDDILHAWRQLPEAVRPALDIVGDGEERALLEQDIRRYGLEGSIHLLGARTAAWLREHGPQYYALVTAFKETADGSKDTFPMVLKEAMAMGLPIVTTDCGGIAALAGPSARICPPADPAELAAAVMQLTSLPMAEHAELAEAGRAYVMEHFTLQQQAAQLSALITSLR